MKMENWEIQSMKDDLSLLGYEFEGTRDGDTIKKTCEYINYLEEKLIKLANDKEKAKDLLRKDGYVVKKITKIMEEDAKACEECDYEGDCTSCSCSINLNVCLMLGE